MNAGLFALSDKHGGNLYFQDVPTYFYAMQRSRLPIITRLLNRGLSDINRGEATKNNYIKFCVYMRIDILLVSSISLSLAFGVGQESVVTSLVFIRRQIKDYGVGLLLKKLNKRGALGAFCRTCSRDELYVLLDVL